MTIRIFFVVLFLCVFFLKQFLICQINNENYSCAYRFYDPKLGRFTQTDTVIPSPTNQGLNRLAYVNNNPIKYIDPTGHVPQDLDPPEDNSSSESLMEQITEKAKNLALDLVDMGADVVDTAVASLIPEKIVKEPQKITDEEFYGPQPLNFDLAFDLALTTIAPGAGGKGMPKKQIFWKAPVKDRLRPIKINPEKLKHKSGNRKTNKIARNRSSQVSRLATGIIGTAAESFNLSKLDFGSRRAKIVNRAMTQLRRDVSRMQGWDVDVHFEELTVNELARRGGRTVRAVLRRPDGSTFEATIDQRWSEGDVRNLYRQYESSGRLPPNVTPPNPGS